MKAVDLYAAAILSRDSYRSDVSTIARRVAHEMCEQFGHDWVHGDDPVKAGDTCDRCGFSVPIGWIQAAKVVG